MVLTVLINSEEHHATDEAGAERIISKVMESLDYGGIAWLSIDKQIREEGVYADNTLKVVINRSTGYGGLVWHVGTAYPEQGGIYSHTWISDNPEPPTTDPMLLSDPWHPVSMEPASALPLTKVREVLGEFCRAGTGDRPACISWVKGKMNGEREELGAGVEPAPHSSTDWDSLVGEIVNLCPKEGESRSG
ncbi:Imm1 family immunity protein [Kitasatospora sp. NPDC008115]|uniref:Imm1 family immunity protein n=1 Tax=Kitasatospora sp. NPDC008115 TaxID=3364022 RepID=UPI0036EF67D2